MWFAETMHWLVLRLVVGSREMRRKKLRPIWVSWRCGESLEGEDVRAV